MAAHSESLEPNDIRYLFAYLQERGFIKGSHDLIQITVEGYAYLYEMENKQAGSKQAFIAMWFDATMKDAFDEGIAAGVRDAGYQPIRIDRIQHNNKIDDEIIAEIRRSRFLVADFTQGNSGARGGVYYEAGFAHGLNIPVIFTCRDDALSHVHFDTRQYNHIVWTTPAELRSRLANRISATLVSRRSSGIG